MNLFYHSTMAGLVGALLVNGFTYLFRFVGTKTSTPWEIAANVFLNRHLIHTPEGIIIGLAGTVGLSITIALIIAYTLNVSGYNMAWLKGVIISNSFGLGTLGLFTRLLNIWPQIRNEPGTYLSAIIILSITGIIIASLLTRWQQNALNQSS